MKNRYFILFLMLSLITNISFTQDCVSSVVLKLINTRGGFHVNQIVKLTSLADSKVFTSTSDTKGEVTFVLPCDQNFDVEIANYPSKNQVRSAAYLNSKSTRSYSYAPDMIEKQKEFAMSDVEKEAVDKNIKLLPDTTRIFKSIMQVPKTLSDYTTMDITLKGLDSKYLVDEEIVFTGNERKKSFIGKTNSQGKLHLYLPKGDIYTINFQYHKGYKIHEVKYTKGTATAGIDIMYMGTIEYLRRKKIEDARIIEEKKQVAAALLQAENEFNRDKVVSIVLNRNKWEEKLFISDVSSEMLPYATKLVSWYKLNEQTEKNTQFVFFYNGTKRQNANSCCAFYQKADGHVNLMKLVTDVHSQVGMKTCQNDIEGLITNLGVNNPYKEIVLLVDKDAHLQDFEYLCQLGKPVHVIMCVDNRTANAQHLTVAWKTKGSVHTMDEDILNIGNKVEGDIVVVRGIKYKLMGGQFIIL